MSRRTARFRPFVLLLFMCAHVGCEAAPAEPTAPSAPKPKASAKELTWTAPPGWELEKDAGRGKYRAKYKVPKQGGDKLDAELLVQRFSTAKKVAAERDYFVALWEKTTGPSSEDAGNVTWVEISGKYKFPMGPAVGPTRKHSAHVIKEDWSGIIAMVKTDQLGHWFFRMVGPKDTVAAAKSAFRAMIDAATP